MGTQKNRLIEQPKHMLKMMGKKILTVLHRKILFIKTCVLASHCKFEHMTGQMLRLIGFFYRHRDCFVGHPTLLILIEYSICEDILE